MEKLGSMQHLDENYFKKAHKMSSLEQAEQIMTLTISQNEIVVYFPLWKFKKNENDKKIVVVGWVSAKKSKTFLVRYYFK